MKFKKVVALVIIQMALGCLVYGQFPVGKNIRVAKNELKLYLKSKGFTYLKEGYSGDTYETLLFSEEFKIFLMKNYYDNVTHITINTFKESIMERLKGAFIYPKWLYMGEFPNAENEIESVFFFKDYRIRWDHSPGIYQFVVSSKEGY
jgi:hypothetical protein